jgi:predicted RNA-binding Zn ribbon-like protein
MQFILVTLEREDLILPMISKTNGPDATTVAPLFTGDHPALDFLNTVILVNGEAIDLLRSDGDVLRWLAACNFPHEVDSASIAADSLRGAAHHLRDAIRELVEARKAGTPIDPSALNAFLANSQSHAELSTHPDGTLALKRKWRLRTAREILAPLAESAADLLANGDIHLIRRCESNECVLWFYDRSKSHHRRWCSMAACGNRHKVAAFRKRNQAN